MTWLIYMPYFDGKGRGVVEAQTESRTWFYNLMKDYEQKLSVLNEYDVEFNLIETTGANEDRLPFFKSIWTKYDLIMVESTKVPTNLMIKALIDCEYDLCTQNNQSNLLQRDGTVFKFPAHKIYTDKPPQSIATGCTIDDLYLRYCQDYEDFCDVTDLGIIKISKNFQLQHPKPTFIYDEHANYNTVERLHRWLRSETNTQYKPQWHRHKELAKRNQLFHHRNYQGESEYLTYDQMMRLYKP